MLQAKEEFLTLRSRQKFLRRKWTGAFASRNKVMDLRVKQNVLCRLRE